MPWTGIGADKLTCTAQTPADSYSVTASYFTMSATWQDTNAAEYLAAVGSPYPVAGGVGIRIAALWWSINGGVSQSRTITCDPLVTSKTVTQQLTGLEPGDRISWGTYAVGWGGNPRVIEYNSDTATRMATVAADSTGPAISSRAPTDASSAAPPKTFGATVSDAFGVASVELWIGGVKEHEVTGLDTVSYSYSHSVQTIAVGALTWYLVATDVNGNVTTSPTWTFTATNIAPSMPGVPYFSFAAGVGGTVRVRWTASVDYNGDAITYQLQVDYGGAGWGNIATGIGAAEYTWTPTTAGAAQLRVRATDGTATSSWRTTDYFTIDANTVPNAPTLVLPNGTESLTEGQTFTITWTEASPRDAEGNAVTYEGEFSELGTFADAVEIFSGVAQGLTSYDWTLTAAMVTADRTVSKVRIRARDIYNGVSAWATSAAIDVVENAAPVVSWVGLVDGDTLTTTTPVLTMLLTDADSDACHIEIEMSERADFSSPTTPDSGASQIGWTEAASPFSTWTAVPIGGATAANRVRFTVQVALRYDYYYLRARARDSYLTGAWTSTVRVLIAYSGSERLFATIDGTVWYLEDCKITESTGGEPSPIELVVPTLLVEAAANPPTRGDAMSVACNIDGTARTWNGTVEEIVFDGPYVRIACLADDAYLSRKLATGDEASADVGQNLKDFVTSYGGPLTGTGIDVTTGLTAALTGGYKNLREHFGDWSDALRYHLYVDATGDISWKAEADLGVPQYVVREG